MIVYVLIHGSSTMLQFNKDLNLNTLQPPQTLACYVTITETLHILSSTIDHLILYLYIVQDQTIVDVKR